jgi:ABC-type phosphate/phosphonate transport system ATPase subunit
MAGEITLLRLVNRLVDCSSGSIEFGDFPVSEIKGAALRGWRRGCGIVCWHLNLVDRPDVLTKVLPAAQDSRFKGCGVSGQVKSQISLWTDCEV